MFGHEGKQVAIGWLEITNPEHVIQLPKRIRAAERRRAPFTVPFTVDRTLLERIGDVNYPAGGVDLAADS